MIDKKIDSNDVARDLGSEGLAKELDRLEDGVPEHVVNGEQDENPPEPDIPFEFDEPQDVVVFQERQVQGPLDEYDRAKHYISNANEPDGNRNNGLNGITYRVAERFRLTEQQIMQLMLEWARGVGLKDFESRSTIKSALKACLRDGQVCAKRTEPTGKAESVVTPPDAPPATGAGADVIAQLEDEVSGKRYAVPLPWFFINRLTRALLPGTVTIICASKGTAKSFMVLEACAFWLKNAVPFSLLALEEDRTFHLRRSLAQESGNSKLMDPEWVKTNPAEARSIAESYKAFMDAMGASIFQRPDSISVDTVLKWIESEIAAGKRVIVVDPITAKDPSNKPWIDDHRFVMCAKKILTKAQASLILVTHPVKQTTAQKSKGGGKRMNVWGEDTAGGAAYENFTQTVLYIEKLNPAVKINVKNQHGQMEDAVINRSIQMRKTRNGTGDGMVVGMYFDATNLRHIERGVRK